MLKELHITMKEILEVKHCTLRYIAEKLINAGAPIKIKSITKIYLDARDVEFGGGLESHPDIHGGVTYIWD